MKLKLSAYNKMIDMFHTLERLQLISFKWQGWHQRYVYSNGRFDIEVTNEDSNT